MASSSSNGHSSKLFDVARSVNWSQNKEGGGNLAGNKNTSSTNRSDKRKRRNNKGGDSDEETEDGKIKSAPVNDIYRKRQQKKMR